MCPECGRFKMFGQDGFCDKCRLRARRRFLHEQARQWDANNPPDRW